MAHFHKYLQSPGSVSAEPTPHVSEESSCHSHQIPVPTEMLDPNPIEDNDAVSSVWQVNPEEYSPFLLP